MQFESKWIEKIEHGQICLGAAISSTDPSVTEALCSLVDFFLIDMEHNPLSLETVQAHLMANKGNNTTHLVRVPWNNPTLIKPVLDLGAPGVIIPFVCTPEEARLAVSGCLYPPDGVRGLEPRRPSNYGRVGGPEFCKAANNSIIIVIQIEHIKAIQNLNEILCVDGLTSIMIGLNDLGLSMGHPGEPDHPEVLEAAVTVIRKCRKTKVFVGVAGCCKPEVLGHVVKQGAQWIMVGDDVLFSRHSAETMATRIRNHCKSKT